MPITAKQTRTRLTATLTLIDKLHRLPPAVAAIHAAVDNGTDVPDRPRSEDAGIRGKGAHSDPTADTAIARAFAHERHLDDVDANLATLALAAANLVDIANRWTPASETPPAARCTGGRTIDPWSRPDCTNWAAETAAGRPRGDGLCDACRMRRHRWESAQRGAA